MIIGQETGKNSRSKRKKKRKERRVGTKLLKEMRKENIKMTI